MDPFRAAAVVHRVCGLRLFSVGRGRVIRYGSGYDDPVTLARTRGRPPHPDLLTPAEWHVVNAVRHGMSNRDIARHRGTSLDAVKFHITNALGKLGLARRADLKRWRGAPFDSALRKSLGGARGRPFDSAQGRPFDSAQGRPAEHARQQMEHPVPATLTLGRVGQISREAKDLDRSVAWFRDVLGLPLLGHYGNLALFDMDGVRLFLSHHDDGNSSGYSVIYFRVEDIEAAYTELQARGITFRGAPHMIHRHPDGTEEWMAFFDDPDGQPLAIMAQIRSQHD